MMLYTGYYYYCKDHELPLPDISRVCKHPELSTPDKALCTQYSGLFQSAYEYMAEMKAITDSVSNEEVKIEQVLANIVVECTLRVAADESNMSINTLKQLKVGGNRRNVHDDTTVVVMFI